MGELSGIRFGTVIAAAAKAHGLDPTLLAAVAAQETGGPGSDSGRNIVGDGGHGHGLFQIDDRYNAFASTPAAMDVKKNADYAASMIQQNLKATGGNIKQALSMYNAGSPNATGTTTKWGDGQVLGYADSVMRHVRELGTSLAGELKAGQADDAASISGLAAAAARSISPHVSSALGAVAQAIGSLPGFGTNATTATTSASTRAGGAAQPFDTGSLVSGLLQSVSGAPASSSTSSSAGSSSALTDPGALSLASPVTQTGYTYHSYQSEEQAGSGAAADADKNIGTLVDTDSDVFDAAPGDDR